jgi:hypothetical protein
VGVDLGASAGGGGKLTRSCDVVLATAEKPEVRQEVCSYAAGSRPGENTCHHCVVLGQSRCEDGIQCPILLVMVDGRRWNARYAILVVGGL